MNYSVQSTHDKCRAKVTLLMPPNQILSQLHWVDSKKKTIWKCSHFCKLGGQNLIFARLLLLLCHHWTLAWYWTMMETSDQSSPVTELLVNTEVTIHRRCSVTFHRDQRISWFYNSLRTLNNSIKMSPMIGHHRPHQRQDVDCNIRLN